MDHEIRSKLDFGRLPQSMANLLYWDCGYQTISGGTPSTSHTHAHTQPRQWRHLSIHTNLELQKKIDTIVIFLGTK